MKKILSFCAVIIVFICILTSFNLSTGENASDEYVANTNVDESIDENTSKSANESANEGTDKTTYKSETTSESYDEECNIYFLDVGQGNCTLVELGDNYMVIDGGNSSTSSFVVSYLKNMGIDNFQYLIATHYDADHISGLVGIMNVFDIDNILAPDYTADSKIYSSFINMADKKDYEINTPQVGETYSFGEAYFTIIAPNSKNYSEENDYSIGIKFCYGDNSFILSGDATSVSESEMIAKNVDLSADIYVVNHHGSKYSSTSEFINAINPKYAVISVGADNSYGHPAEQTLSRLSNKGIEILRTDELGTIKFTMDGSSLRYETEKTKENISSGNSTSNETSSAASSSSSNVSDDVTYILNSNSKKIHKTTCSSVSNMVEKNKIYYSGTLDDALSDGYEKCKRCF